MEMWGLPHKICMFMDILDVLYVHMNIWYIRM